MMGNITIKGSSWDAEDTILVDTVSDLRGVVKKSGIIWLKGTTTVGDGGYASYCWDGARPIIDDDGYDVIAPNGATVGCWIRNVSAVTETHKAYFSVNSPDPLTLSTDENSPSILTGLVFDNSAEGFELEAAAGGVRNVTGRSLALSAGIFSLHLSGNNSGDKTVMIYSERTTVNDTTWEKNANSGREIYITDDTITYASKSSEAFIWPNNSIIRFRMFTDVASVALSPVSFTAEGDTVEGPAFKWWMSEK